MMKPWVRKEPRSAPPLTPDDVVRLPDSVRNHKPPASLGHLLSTNSFSAPGNDPDVSPDKLIRRLHLPEGMRGWNLPDHAIVRGLPGRESGRLSRATVRAAIGESTHTEGFRPDWADLMHVPRVSAGLSRPTMRRMNGRRVRPTYVFGNDDRVPFYPTGYPWQCIGRVFVWTDPSNPNWQWSGSGALVRHNTILTAGHVAPWGANPWMVQFVPAYYNGSSTLGSGVLSYVESYWGYNTNDTVSAWDYCVMKLYDPLGDQLGWFGTKTYDDGWNDGNYWTLVGYPGAVANAQQPSYQNGISFHDTDGDGDAEELETDNGDSSPGDSGGPLFAWWADGWPYIVGVVSGEEEEYQFPFSSQDNNIAAAGSPMVDLVQWAEANWP
jgi:V8-like Glu-specific endopeptidase